MTLSATAVVTTDFQSAISSDAELPDEAQLQRASTYAFMAAVLRDAPDQTMLDQIKSLSQQTDAAGDELMLSMHLLGMASTLLDVALVDDEYHDLFIGLGKGEVVPYGSWYLTGFLMEKPLSDLRDDLQRLGYERNSSIVEPEDHVAALCEVMSMMIADGFNLAQQKQFFQTHMASWMGRFFDDLSNAKSAVFYKAFGRFGAAFVAFEDEYFSMEV